MNRYKQDAPSPNNETNWPSTIETSIAGINQDSPDYMLINMAKGDLDAGHIYALLSQSINDNSNQREDKKKKVTIDLMLKIWLIATRDLKMT